MTFKLMIPNTEGELQQELMDDEARILAGGTDLMVQMRSGKVSPTRVVSIKKLERLKEIYDLGERIRIGAAVTYSELQKSRILQEKSPILLKAIRQIGSVQIRNRGTAVGNIANASPAGDAVLAMVLSEATVEIMGPKGERHESIESFIIGPGRTTLSTGEYIRAVVIEKTDDWQSLFIKVGQRNAMCISVASIGVLRKGKEVRLAFGSVAPVVVRAHKAERFFTREGIDGTKLGEFVERCVESISPIDDVRASSWYRRQVVRGELMKIFGHPDVGGTDVT